jgi:hypothetical protein
LQNYIIVASSKRNTLKPSFKTTAEVLHLPSSPPCSLDLSATSQQYFSLRTNQPPATRQQYFSLRTNQHQPSATSQTNRLKLLAFNEIKLQFKPFAFEIILMIN